MKTKQILMILMILLFITGCQNRKEEEQTPQNSEAQTAEPEAFKYIHDPRDNPEAMKDIIEDPEAVYGFSPDPNSTRLGTYAEYDWSDPEFVAGAKKNRQEYNRQMASMVDILYKMRDDGASTEEIARAVSGERNRLRMTRRGLPRSKRAILRPMDMKKVRHPISCLKSMAHGRS